MYSRFRGRNTLTNNGSNKTNELLCLMFLFDPQYEMSFSHVLRGRGLNNTFFSSSFNLYLEQLTSPFLDIPWASICWHTVWPHEQLNRTFLSILSPLYVILAAFVCVFFSGDVVFIRDLLGRYKICFNFFERYVFFIYF